VLARLPPSARRMLTVRTVGPGAAALDRLDAPPMLALPATASRSARLAAVLVTGLAGGCRPDLRTGDVVVGDPVATQRELYHASADPRLRGRALRALDAAGLRHRVGRLLTVDEVVASPAAKAGFWQTQGALAVDMESGHVLAWASRAGLPALAVRAVADGPEDEVPPELLSAVGPDGRVRLAMVARFLRRPGLLHAAWGLGRRSRLALGSLARFVQAFLDLPGDP
jgi:adenosylhomocysteine nucleosidase